MLQVHLKLSLLQLLLYDFVLFGALSEVEKLAEGLGQMGKYLIYLGLSHREFLEETLSREFEDESDFHVVDASSELEESELPVQVLD